MAGEVSTSDVVKVCVSCGADLAGRPRIKDSVGDYWCKSPCWEQQQSPVADVPQIDELQQAVAQHKASRTATFRRAVPVKKKGFNVVRTLILLVVGSVATCAIIYFAVLQPQNAQIKQTLSDAVANTDKSIATDATIAEREQEVVHRRLMAEEARSGGKKSDDFLNEITENGKLRMTEVVEKDPIVGPLAKSHPGLLDAIRSNDYLVVWAFYKDLPKEEVPSRDRNYLNVFAKTIENWPDHR